MCVGVIASFAGIILGYFFQKWSDERKRAWELEDRKNNKRTEIRDMRIKEAREFLDTYVNVLQEITNLEGSITEEVTGVALSPLMVQPDTFENKLRKYQQMYELLSDTKKKAMSILILNDMELNEQYTGLASFVIDEMGNLARLLKSVADGDVYEDSADYVKRVLTFHERALAYIQVMQTRLDEIAGTTL